MTRFTHRQGRKNKYPVCDKEEPDGRFGEMSVKSRGQIRTGKHPAGPRPPGKST